MPVNYTRMRATSTRLLSENGAEYLVKRKGTVTVIGGVTIGEGCVIGAGSVVTRDIPPHTVAVGNPARPIREITDKDASALQYYAQ